MNNLEAVLGCELNILIISAVEPIIESLKNSLLRVKKEDMETRPYYCKVNTCRNINDVRLLGGNPVDFDYVVIIMQGKNPFCITEADENISFLGSTFSRHRICMVGIDCCFGDSVTPRNLWKFAETSQINLIMGSVLNEEATDHMSRRLLTTAEAVHGLHNSIPLIATI